MACFHPLTAYRSAVVNPATGKRQLTFASTKAHVEGSALKLPCGRCIGCRVDHSGEWALRCSHEAQMHDRNCFATFTYSDEGIPPDWSVKKRDMQLFMMRLRLHLWRDGRQKVRQLMAGEYADETLRPHYHGLLFGYDFPDKRKWSMREGHQTYRSDLLEKLWPHGLCELGSVTFKSSAYVARYCMKKVSGDRADDHYSRVSPVDGQVYRVEPEFLLPSLRPGIGQAWFDRFGGDAFPSDFLMMEGRRVTPPRFYLAKLAKVSEPEAEKVRRGRKRLQAKPAMRWNRTPERLVVREVCAAARLKELVRPLR